MRRTLAAVVLGTLIGVGADGAQAQNSAFNYTVGYTPQLVLNGEIFVDAILQGRYRWTGTNGFVNNGGYTTGTNAQGHQLRSFLVFDLSNYQELDIFSVSLRMYTGGVEGGPLNINFFSYSSATTTMPAWSTAGYQDAGSGNFYAGRFFGAADANQWVTLTLSPGAISDASSRQYFGVGGAAGATVTPEPISMILVGSGLAGIGAVARRRRQAGDPVA